jgi:hypothetical protein
MRRTICILIVLAALLGIVSLAAAQATTDTEVRQEFDVEIWYSWCPSSEPVLYSGTAHFVVHRTTDASGGYHFRVNTNSQQLSGVGQWTGTRYRLRIFEGSYGVNSNSSDLLPTEWTQVTRGIVIGQGPGNNDRIRFQLHGTINANGDATVERLEYIEICNQ